MASAWRKKDIAGREGGAGIHLNRAAVDGGLRDRVVHAFSEILAVLDPIFEVGPEPMLESLDIAAVELNVNLAGMIET
ncbi:MAG: hypothetical protein HY706_13550 [Candidatus Hydrogenedentes bacterium]|nr:hypothetical protein [Candidatus Hydrogenedentota bacterium]